MEWLKQMSLKKSLSVIIVAFIACGLIFYFLTKLALNSLLSPPCLCSSPLSILNLVFPFAVAVSMPMLAAALFYKIKLKIPLAQLRMGAKRIMENDLDFSVKYNSKDELGQLCESFESMRIELLNSNRELWRQMEERKRLNAAFAHDLRNPVTVLKGSAMILQKELEQEHLAIERAEESISLITQYAERIESYIQAMTSVQKLEELTIAPKEVDWFVLTKELEYSLSILSAKEGKEIKVLNGSENRQICVDQYVVHNVAENLISNALRYSKDEIEIDISCDHEKIVMCVSDDGKGFSERILKKGVAPFLREPDEDHGQHFGMGLYICRLLCEKHSGTLTLKNGRNGAKVTATFYF